MTIDIQVPYRFSPRSYQLPVLKSLDKGINKIVWCAHRRSGKDITILNWVIKTLVQGKNNPKTGQNEAITAFYIMPSYAQAKKVIWDAITNDGIRMLDFIPSQVIAQKNSQEMKVRFTNGSLLQLIGSENIDSLMGTNPWIVVFSEYAIQDPSAWDYIRPILRVNKGYAIFISTPRGKNHFYDLFRMAKNTDGWWAQKLTINDTNVLTEEDIQNEKNEGMSEELIQQEYFCSFDRGVEGSYYSLLVKKMEKEERIGDFGHDEYKLVHTAWDLGWNDSTAIIFFQVSGDKIKIIDTEEHNNQTLAWYKALLTKKGYKYGTHLFPHDVEQNDGLSTGCTRKELLQDLNIPVTTVPRISISDGIESSRALLSSRLQINQKCQNFLKSLEHYHKDWDDKHKVYSNKPRHDWSSHYCDALRMLAVGLKKIDSDFIDPSSEARALRSYFGG